MTAELEYTYKSVDWPIEKIDIDKLVRAVRIKLGVKEKLINNYKVESDTKVETPAVESEVKESLIDTSDSNLLALNQKLDAMQGQKIPYQTKRAVLFTKALVEKIKKVSSKWLISEIKKEEPAVGVENMSIPNSWESALLSELEINKETNEEVPSVESTIQVEPVASVMPAIETTTMPNEEVSTEVELPAQEETPSVEEPKTIETEMPVSNSFDFAVPSFDFNQKSEEPSEISVPSFEQKNEEPSAEISTPSFDFMPNNEVPSEVVPEPQEIGENPMPSVEVPVASETVEEKPQSIEDKIQALLNRSVEEPSNSNNDISKEPSQADVIARVQKAKNTLRDKETEIASLKNKVDELNDRYSKTRAKLEGYNAVIRDVTHKYDETAKSNEELKAKYEQMEETLKSQIADLEQQLKDERQARANENERSREEISSLKSKHSEEIENINRNNNQKLQSIKEEKDRQLKEAYKGIMEVLSPSEESYQAEESYKKAA